MLPHGAVRSGNLPGVLNAPEKRMFLASTGTHRWSLTRPPVDVRGLVPQHQGPPAPAPVIAPVADDHINPVGLPTAKPRRGKAKVDTAKAFAAFYANREALLERTVANSTFDLHNLAATTLSNYDAYERLWLEYFTLFFQSPRIAALTLQGGQALPEEGVIKSFFEFFAKTRGPNGRGLSYISVIKVQSAVMGMLYRHGVETPSSGYRESIKNMIDKMAKQTGEIEDRKRETRLMRTCDLVTFLGAILDPGLAIGSQKTRVRLYFLTTVMAELGTRIGTNAQGLVQCTRWADTEVFIEGGNQWGLDMRVFFTFRWMKNHKHDSESFKASCRALHGPEAHTDPVLPLLAIGCHYAVWEETEQVLEWMTGAAPPPTERVALTVRDEFKKTGILRASVQPKDWSDLNTTNQPLMYQQRPEPQAYKTSSSSSAHTYAGKIGRHCGLADFHWKVLRYTHSEHVKKHAGKEIVAIAMGHRHGSSLSYMTYRAPVIPEDLQSRRRGQIEDTSSIDFYNSIARNAVPPSTASLHEETIKRTFTDSKVEKLGLLYEQLDFKVHEKYGKWTDELPDVEDDELLEEARDLQNKLLRALFDLTLSVSDEISTSSEDTPSESRSASLGRLINALVAGHPFLPLVSQDGGRHGRRAVFQAFTCMMGLDELALHRKCYLCLREGTDKDLKGNYGVHMWKCMEAHFSSTHTRCPFCGVIFLNDDDEGKDDVGEYEQHRQQCYVLAMAEFNENIEATELAGRPLGIDSYKRVLDSENACRTVYYCPVCINDHDNHWDKCGTNDKSAKEMIRYMMAHCKTILAPKFALERTYYCSIYTCRKSAPKYDTVGMLDHWHNVHGYSLLQCVDTPYAVHSIY
ncbi:hypothetical protein BD626DRAFT_393206 [Schizophyllum amplum]|uniref:Uncharacterized protein n=1 Tax=Schizophyllum amplum TaxID=97359 RepID=A0A550CXW8_9AGAR|nr:hypothetical protein BD626DRAFT_393206 [Auriculariopsis ampla]